MSWKEAPDGSLYNDAPDLSEATEAAARSLFESRTHNDWDKLPLDIRGIWRAEARATIAVAFPHILEAIAHKADLTAAVAGHPDAAYAWVSTGQWLRSLAEDD